MNSKKKIVIAVLAFFTGTALVAKTGQESALPTLKSGFKTPPAFTENKGQIKDVEGKAHSEILFTALVGNTQLYFKPDGVSYIFSDQKKTGINNKKNPSGLLKPGSAEPVMINMYRTDMQLLGCNSNTVIKGENKQESYKNYYTGNSEEITHVSSFGKIIYENIYPEIDLIYTIGEKGLKYDFIVHPGGDPANIRFQYIAADNVSLDKEKGLTAKNPLGEISDENPFSFQQEDQQKIKTNYVQKNNVISFKIGNYDKSKTLVIDPFLRTWGTYFGGDENDNIAAIDYVPSTVFANAGIYVAGGSTSFLYLTTTGAYSMYNSGLTDAFLARFNTNGGIIWATYFGGANDDYATCIDANLNGVVIGGVTSSNSGISGGSYVHQSGPNGYNDGFIAKFSTNGLRTWSTYYGGTDADYIYGIAIDDSNDKIAVCGRTGSTSYIATSGSYKATKAPLDGEGFVAEFSSAGVRQWGTYFPGTYSDLFDVAFKTDHTVAVCGDNTTSFSLASGVNTVQPTVAGGFDAYIGILNTTGSGLIFSTFFGGPGNEHASAITVDGSGNLIVVGSTESSSNIASTGAAQPVYAGATDAFVVRYSSAFAKSWSTYFGSSGNDDANSVSSNANGEVFVAGPTSPGTPSLASADAIKNTNTSSKPDIYVAKFNSGGVLNHCTYYGTNLLEPNGCVSVDNAGSVVIAGTTWGSDGTGGFNLATAGAYQNTNHNTYTEGFIGLLYDNEINIIGVTPSSVCAGQTISISYTVLHNFYSSNYFTAQLSDASGNFGSPVDIGLAFSTTSGTLTATIPATVAPTSSNYRVRIHSSASTPGVIYSLPSPIFTIRESPATPSITTNTPVCEGQFLSLSTNTVPNVGYHWAGPNGFTSTVQNPWITPITSAGSGVYTLSLSSNTTGCWSPLGAAFVTVSPTPVSETIVANGPTKACDTSRLILSVPSITGYTYQWMLNGVDISGATNVAYAPGSSGTYQVRIGMSGSPCFSYSNNVDVTFYSCGKMLQLAPSASDTDADTDWQLFPNPADGIITLASPKNNPAGQCEIQIYNALTQLVYSGKTEAGNSTPIDLSEFRNGIYFLKINNSGKFIYKQFVVGR